MSTDLPSSAPSAPIASLPYGAPDDPSGAGPVPPRPGAPGEDFFGRIRALGIVRPDQGRWAAGVATGLAHRWGVDPLLIRGAFVALSLFGGAGIALYGVCWLLLPHPDGRIHAQQVLQGKVTPGFVGAVLAILTNLPTTGAMGWDAGPFGWQPGGFFAVAAVGAGAWWLVTHRPDGQPAEGQPAEARPADGQWVDGQRADAQRADATLHEPPAAGPAHPVRRVVQPPPPDLHAPSHALTRLTLGAALIAVVAVGVAGRFGAGPDGYAWLVAAAVALGVVSLGLIVAGLRGRRGGGLAPIAVLIALVAVNGAVVRGTVGAVGERVWSPTAAAAIPAAGYELGAGDAVLDLTAAGLLTQATAAAPLRISVQMGAGRLRIVVPTGVPVEVDTRVGLGQVVDSLNHTQVDGAGNEKVVRAGGSPAQLVVSAELGLGDLEVVPQGTDLTLGSTR